MKVVEVGPIAARALDRARHGRVVAVFEHSLYVELGNGVVGVCAPELGSGPLNALLASADAMRALRSSLHEGQRVRGGARRLRLGSQLLDCTSARVWRPPPLPQPIDRTRLAAGIARIRAVAQMRAPDDGFAFLVARRSPSTLLAASARAATVALHAWVGGSDGGAPVPGHLAALVGLGPGLTPSGDDFLGGALIALHAFGFDVAAQRLAASILPCAERDTHPVSVAHLSAAREGLGSAALHACLRDIVEARDPGANLERIAAIGHTSGWDALAGVVTVAETVAAASDLRARRSVGSPSACAHDA